MAEAAHSGDVAIGSSDVTCVIDTAGVFSVMDGSTQRANILEFSAFSGHLLRESNTSNIGMQV
jgi:hypothetical protein